MKIYMLGNSVHKVEFKDFFFSIDLHFMYGLGYTDETFCFDFKLNKKFKSEIRCIEFMFKESSIIKELVDESEFNEVEIINGVDSSYEEYGNIYTNRKTDYYFNFNDGRKLFNKYLNFVTTKEYREFIKGKISAKQLIENFIVEGKI